jgi:hypothetical protein
MGQPWKQESAEAGMHGIIVRNIKYELSMYEYVIHFQQKKTPSKNLPTAKEKENKTMCLSEDTLLPKVPLY